MELTVEHSEGEDFGTIHVGFDRDDTGGVAVDGTYGTVFRFALYQHEAAELIEKLRPIAESDPL